MKRILVLTTAVAVAAGVPAGAVAKPEKDKKPTPRAKVLRTTLEPVGADAAYSAMRGRSTLVINKRNASAVLRLKGMPAGDYSWAILSSEAAAGACDGTPVSSFKYRKLRARPSGVANSTAKAKKFSLDRDASYAVVVRGADGSDLLCGTYAPKGKKGKKPSKKPSKKPARAPQGGKGKTRS